MSRRETYFFFCALTLAHLALAAARIRAIPAADIRRFGRTLFADVLPFSEVKTTIAWSIRSRSA